MVGHDIIFYHGHRMLHHRQLYKHIHKKHHEWQAPIAAAAIYAHPLEHSVTGNQLILNPDSFYRSVFTGIVWASAGLLITKPPLAVMWLWYMWLGFQVQNDHSGYHFPLMFSPEFHDYHHLK